MAFAPGFLFYFSASSSVIFTSLKVGWCTSKPFFFYGLCDPWRRPSSSTMESQPSQHWTLLAPWPLLLAIKQWNHDDDDDKINLVIIYSWPKEKCLQQKSSGSIDLFHYLFFSTNSWPMPSEIHWFCVSMADCGNDHILRKHSRVFTIN